MPVTGVPAAHALVGEGAGPGDVPESPPHATSATTGNSEAREAHGPATAESHG